MTKLGVSIVGVHEHIKEYFADYIHSKYKYIEGEDQISEAQVLRTYQIKIWNGTLYRFIAGYDIMDLGYKSVIWNHGSVVVFVFDVDDMEAFHKISEWVGGSNQRGGNPIIMVGIVTTETIPEFTVRITPEDVKKYRKEPYYELQLFNNNTVKQFHKTFNTLVELTFLRFLREETIYKNLDFYPEQSKKDVGGDDLYHIYPFSQPAELLDEQQRFYYESLFSRVFRNKVLLSYIFKQVNVIHTRHKIRSFGYYDITPSKLISNGYTDSLLTKAYIDLDYNYLDVVNLLRARVPFDLFMHVYQRFPDNFDHTVANGNIFWTIDYSSPHYSFRPILCRTKAFSTLENACIGGSLPIVQFLYETKRFELSGNCLEFAAALGHLDVVKYLVGDLNILVDQKPEEARTPLLERCIKISKRYAYVEMFEYLIPLYSGNNPIVDRYLEPGHPQYEKPSKSVFSNFLKYIKE
ncbi:hypothetical protein CYY_009248 [Polysphondylium violaceum]|uniref:Ankyrin repeat-containing protein n=1 Tax=Polysphondylium violaceum TaxID=133409 RepID=A0A8J4UPM6_9MYCE|nr:hypothetical protein CYY_009248 [Polysphondylium violaceum]